MSAELRDKIRSLRIVDGHGHLGFYRLFNIPDSDVDGIVKTLDNVGIEQICVSAMIGIEADSVLGNDIVGEAVRKYPDRIMGFAVVNPYEQEEIIPELERCFDRLAMSAIKLHPELIECPADSPLYTPVYEFAQERRLAIMNHSWGTGANLRKLAEKYPAVSFIQAHYGSAWDGNLVPEIFPAIRELDNVYLDTAGSGGVFGSFQKIFDYFGEDKLIFGTDLPFINAAQQIGNVVLSGIPERSLKKILRENFLELVNRKSYNKVIIKQKK